MCGGRDIIHPTQSTQYETTEEIKYLHIKIRLVLFFLKCKPVVGQVASRNHTLII